MPEKDGKLLPEERNKAAEWFRTHWTQNYPCPVSGDNKWAIAEHLIMPITSAGAGGLLLGGVGYPQIMIICGGCGFTLYFNAVMIGIVVPAEPPKEVPKETPKEAQK